ncbi:hypothetical protein MauCBS54593_006323 [Microsporum audouinii]
MESYFLTLALGAFFVHLTLYCFSLNPWLQYYRIPGPSASIFKGIAQKWGKYPWKQLRKWSVDYGDLFHFRLGTEHFVYVNSREAVHELLEKQSLHTSSKGPMVGATQIVSGLRLALMPYSQRWRRLRATIHKVLTPKMSSELHPSQEFETKKLVHDLLEHREKGIIFDGHIKRYSLSVILTLVYGIRCRSKSDSTLHKVYQIMAEFSETTKPDAFITETIPALAYLPAWMQWWRKEALKYYQNQHDLWMKLWKELEAKSIDGKAPPCFALDLMQNRSLMEEFGEVQAAFLAGTMVEAGSETTSSALCTAILYLAANPEAQSQAAIELDRVVGNLRSPSFSDRAQLPFVGACVDEIFRIRPLTRFGTSHYTTADTQYKNTLIPRGTYLVLNQNSLHFDPQYYDKPDHFDPSRHLSKTSGKTHFNFGAGRRICPGMHVAEANMFITLANILWAFDIRPPLAADGRELRLDTSDDAFEPGANTVPLPFPVRFISRNDQRAEIVRADWKNAKHAGYTTRNMRVDLNGVHSLTKLP